MNVYSMCIKVSHLWEQIASSSLKSLKASLKSSLKSSHATKPM